MGRIVYLMNVSLDGFVETPDRSLAWAHVDDELHRWFNEHERKAAAFVYGRRLYEVMAAYWPTAADDPAATQAMLEYAAIWNPKPKVVFSSTLRAVGSNARLARGDPADEVPSLRSEFDGDLHIGGPTLAAPLVRRELVDVFGLVVHPVALAAGTPFWPRLDRELHLRLVDTHRFASGVVYLAYEPVR